MKKIVLLLALLLASGAAFGQEAQGNIPADVFYLLPEFRQGMVYFSDQGPAQGDLNICAVDQTLRFMDKGQELASDADNIYRVIVDDIVFVRVDGAFYRLYPITDDLTLAFRRDVEILRDVKTGAYGTTSRTSSIREVGMLQSDGMIIPTTCPSPASSSRPATSPPSPSAPSGSASRTARTTWTPGSRPATPSRKPWTTLVPYLPA